MLVSEATILYVNTPTLPRPRWPAQDHRPTATTIQPSTTTILNSTRWHFPGQCCYTKEFLFPFKSFINWLLTTSIFSYRISLTMVTLAMIPPATGHIITTPATTSSGRRRTALSRSSTETYSFMWVVLAFKFAYLGKYLRLFSKKNWATITRNR